MKRTILLLALSSNVAFSQNLEWAKNLGGTGDDRANIIQTDGSGNVYVAGAYSGTVDFGTGPSSSSGDLDLFLAKYDASGAALWLVNGGDVFDDVILGMAVDNAGNAYVCGYGEIVSDGSSRASYVSKIANDGTVEWSHILTSDADYTAAYGISIDDSGNAYVSGHFMGTADFDPSTTASSTLTAYGTNSDIFILKLNSAGEYVFVKQFESYDSNDNAFDITVDESGNIYTIGQYWNTLDCDPSVINVSLNHSGGGDVFISKLDANGDYVWGKKIGDAGSDYGFSIAVDQSGNVFSTGHFSETVDFDPGSGVENITSNGDRDIFVSKLDSNGDFVWAKSMGESQADRGTDICLDNNDNVYVTGFFQETVDFDPGSGAENLISNGNKDAFIQKLDNDGNFIWAKPLGGNGADEANSIYVDASNTIYVAGNFFNAVDFDPSSATYSVDSEGDRDAFILKWGQSSVSLEEHSETNNFNIYPNPTSGQIHLDIIADEISVYALNGERLMSKEEKVSSIDLSELASGYYLVKVRTANSILTKQLIIE